MARFGMLLAGAILLMWLPFVSAQAERLIDLGDPAVDQGTRPTVLRGSAIAPKPAPAGPTGVFQVEVGAGEDLWLIDRERARLTVCERQFGANVGSRFIACTSRALPAGFAR